MSKELENMFNSKMTGRGRGRGRGIALSGGRKSILAKREKRREEDLANAIKMVAEREQKKKTN
jgi:hypothetical protein